MMKQDMPMAATALSHTSDSRDETPAEFNLNEFIPFLINRSATRVAAAFGADLKAHGINITVWRLIASLRQHGSRRIGELAEFTGIEMWTVSRVVTRLEQDGLVSRSRGDEDGRGVIVSLTPAGERLVATLVPEARGYEGLILEGFSEEEAKSLRRLLDKLYLNMQR
jgi:DNA-binding MarR family transcriptional regulator